GHTTNSEKPAPGQPSRHAVALLAFYVGEGHPALRLARSLAGRCSAGSGRGCAADRLVARLASSRAGLAAHTCRGANSQEHTPPGQPKNNEEYGPRGQGDGPTTQGACCRRQE